MESNPTPELERILQALQVVARKQTDTHQLAVCAALRATLAGERLDRHEEVSGREWFSLAQRVTTLEVGRDERFNVLRRKFEELRSEFNETRQRLQEVKEELGHNEDGKSLGRRDHGGGQPPSQRSAQGRTDG